jgi:hypothetical protein
VVFEILEYVMQEEFQFVLVNKKKKKANKLRGP